MAHSLSDNHLHPSETARSEQEEHTGCHYLQTVTTLLGRELKALFHFEQSEIEGSSLSSQSEMQLDDATRPPLLFKANDDFSLNDSTRNTSLIYCD